MDKIKRYYYTIINQYPHLGYVGDVIIISGVIYFSLVLSNQFLFSFVGITGEDFNGFHFFEYGRLLWSEENLRTKWLLALCIPLISLVALYLFAKNKNLIKAKKLTGIQS